MYVSVILKTLYCKAETIEKFISKVKNRQYVYRKIRLYLVAKLSPPISLEGAAWLEQNTYYLMLLKSPTYLHYFWLTYLRFYVPKTQKMHQRTPHPHPSNATNPPKNNQPSNEPKNKPTNIAQTRANLNQVKCEKNNKKT